MGVKIQNGRKYEKKEDIERENMDNKWQKRKLYGMDAGQRQMVESNRGWKDERSIGREGENKKEEDKDGGLRKDKESEIPKRRVKKVRDRKALFSEHLWHLHLGQTG